MWAEISRVQSPRPEEWGASFLPFPGGLSLCPGWQLEATREWGWAHPRYGGVPSFKMQRREGYPGSKWTLPSSARGLGHVPLRLSFPYHGGDDRSGGVVWHLQGARSQPHTQHYSCYYVWTRRPLRPQHGSLGLPGAPLCGPSSSPWAGPCLSLSCPFPAPAQHLAPPWAYCLRTQGHPVVLGENKGAPHPHFLTRLGLQVPDPALDRINTGAHKGHPGTGGAGWGGQSSELPEPCA